MTEGSKEGIRRSNASLDVSLTATGLRAGRYTWALEHHGTTPTSSQQPPTGWGQASCSLSAGGNGAGDTAAVPGSVAANEPLQGMAGSRVRGGNFTVSVRDDDVSSPSSSSSSASSQQQQRRRQDQAATVATWHLPSSVVSLVEGRGSGNTSVVGRSIVVYRLHRILM